MDPASIPIVQTWGLGLRDLTSHSWLPEQMLRPVPGQGPGLGHCSVGGRTLQAAGLPPHLPGPGWAQGSGPTGKVLGWAGSPKLSTMGDCGSQVLGTLRWERPRPRSSPPPWPLTLKPAPPPARGHTSPGLGLPGRLGQQPSPPVGCLRVLPACPHVGAHWPQVHVFGQQRRDQPLLHLLPLPLSAPLKKLGSGLTPRKSIWLHTLPLRWHPHHHPSSPTPV